MTARAWSCNGCDALVQPDETACHRCGTLRDNNVGVAAAEPGTPAEFVTMVHRTAVGPTPPPRGPLPDTLPVETELAGNKDGKSNTIPGTPAVPILVPQARPVTREPVSAQPKRSWRWIWFVLVPLLLGGGGYLAYVFVEPFQEYVDGMIDAARG